MNVVRVLTLTYVVSFEQDVAETTLNFHVDGILNFLSCGKWYFYSQETFDFNRRMELKILSLRHFIRCVRSSYTSYDILRTFWTLWLVAVDTELWNTMHRMPCIRCSTWIHRWNVMGAPLWTTSGFSRSQSKTLNNL